MPPKLMTLLEGRHASNAAYRIWSECGEEALTMRAVARAAKHHTPSLRTLFPQERSSHAASAARRLNLFSSHPGFALSWMPCRRAPRFLHVASP